MRILLVEDHPDTVEVFQRTLEKDDHAVSTATTVQDAVRTCGEGKFDLLLCDIGLPDGEGWDLAEVARKFGTKAIALTGYGMPSDVEKARTAGFAAHILKPVMLVDLRATIAAVMGLKKPGHLWISRLIQNRPVCSPPENHATALLMSVAFSSFPVFFVLSNSVVTLFLPRDPFSAPVVTPFLSPHGLPPIRDHHR